ncbi:MAG TPA: N-acetylmuramoyl-L-alanine amidase [Streptosporangiaceae bacterium]|nr:N-acetylmuramoyl-L-alanine amidase [Streptosporangiaceae bacterium]
MPRALKSRVRLFAGVTVVALTVVAFATSAVASASSPLNPAARKPLAGKIIGIDPGHNGKNWTDPSFLNHQVWNGREWEDCDTTGTETAGGYTEAKFNFLVATRLAAILRKAGAKVVMTRQNNHGLGPCVNTRAKILDKAKANVSIDIHADYGPSTGRGFTVLEPVADGPNNKVIKSSKRFGKDVHAAFLAHTPMGISNYYGRNGYISRKDLAGLNLTTMAKVLIECGNMNNRADAKLLTSLRVEHEIAYALSVAIIRFLAGH